MPIARWTVLSDVNLAVVLGAVVAVGVTATYLMPDCLLVPCCSRRWWRSTVASLRTLRQSAVLDAGAEDALALPVVLTAGWCAGPAPPVSSCPAGLGAVGLGARHQRLADLRVRPADPR